MLALATSGPSARNEIYFLPALVRNRRDNCARGSPDKILTSRLTDDAPFRTDEKSAESFSFFPTKKRGLDACTTRPVFFSSARFRDAVLCVCAHTAQLAIRLSVEATQLKSRLRNRQMNYVERLGIYKCPRAFNKIFNNVERRVEGINNVFEKKNP